MAALDEPGNEPNFDLFGSFGLDFFSYDKLWLTETDSTEPKENTEQTEIGQLNDEDNDNFIIEKRNRIEANCNFCSGIINLLFDGLAYNTSGHFASWVVFFRAPQRRGKILRNSQNIRTCMLNVYAKPSNKVYLLFHYCVILPYLVKRTRKT